MISGFYHTDSDVMVAREPSLGGVCTTTTGKEPSRAMPSSRGEVFGADGGIRTHDFQNHNLTLLPAELHPPCRTTILLYLNRFRLRKTL
jgi:hypothetical protein